MAEFTALIEWMTLTHFLQILGWGVVILLCLGFVALLEL